jgi:hypothetical protein
VEIKKMDAMWEKMAMRIKTLEDKGDFISVLAFVLDLDKYTNATREGGII